tara:strand:- start:545 stop:787 length:243 start_codon:yes stop_codon:yes gene_type:complete
MTNETNQPLKMEKQSESDQETTLSVEGKVSATTNDIPEFGWSGYAERINGRFAMIGLMAVLLVEAISKISFLEWAGIISQ